MNIENEVELAISKCNDSYMKSCYQSAFKVYKTLQNDNHSGMSWCITRDILIKLLNNQPLIPITEDEFIEQCDSQNTFICSRLSSLFMKIENGKKVYSDVNRVVFYVDKIGFFSGFVTSLIDKLYPITFPYSGEKIEVYGEEFKCNKDNLNDDWDTIGLFYLIKDNKRIALNKFYKQAENSNEMIEINNKEYRKRKFISKL